MKFTTYLLVAGLVGLIALAGPAIAAPTDGVCELFLDKTAQPSNVLIGEEVEITLTLDGRCPHIPGQGQADIVLAIDRSASQYDNGTWPATIEAATAFADIIDYTENKVGVITFSGRLIPFEPETVMRQVLTSDGEAVKSAIAAIPQPLEYTYDTNLTAAVEAAQAELSSPRHRADAQPVLVLLSDGRHTALGTQAPTAAAAAAKDAGTTVITIGLAVDEVAAQTLRDMASRPDLYFAAPTGDDLRGVMVEVAGQVTVGRVTDLTVTDLLPIDVEYIRGSASPVPDSFEANMFVWTLPALQSTGWTARYRVRPLVAGTYATNKVAAVDYIDADSTTGHEVFPQPFITVRKPEPIRVFLPILMRRYCQPTQPFDVVLALDTSSSMWGEKLVRTRQAAREFLLFLQMPPSQAAVVAFNAEATVVQALTPDRRSATSALDNLPLHEGSRIDLALVSAATELRSARHLPEHAPVLILLTDGRQAGAPKDKAVEAAEHARRDGITIYTIGVGDDVDPVLLTELAGDPGRYYAAPSTDDLMRIYREIAGDLPCLGKP